VKLELPDERPDDTNGEQALWIDGQRVSHLGKRFPNGFWTYDKFAPGKGGQGIRWNREKDGPERFAVGEDGAAFEDFRWRTVQDLNVNYVWLYIYTQKPDGHRIKVWCDHVVVATDYIGPCAGNNRPCYLGFCISCSMIRCLALRISTPAPFLSPAK
jgi:hypothetical protein